MAKKSWSQQIVERQMRAEKLVESLSVALEINGENQFDMVVGLTRDDVMRFMASFLAQDESIDPTAITKETIAKVAGSTTQLFQKLIDTVAGSDIVEQAYEQNKLYCTCCGSAIVGDFKATPCGYSVHEHEEYDHLAECEDVRCIEFAMRQNAVQLSQPEDAHLESDYEDRNGGNNYEG